MACENKECTAEERKANCTCDPCECSTEEPCNWCLSQDGTE